MKRKNYYQVHKNKTAKKLKRPVVNILKLKLLNIHLKAFVKNSIIAAAQFSNIIQIKNKYLRT